MRTREVDEAWDLIALVPMRHRSERVPDKNFRPLGGRPLYEYILETLRQVKRVTAIVVDTDSPVIKEGVAAAFPDVITLDRPEHLRAGDIPMNEVLLYDITQAEAPFYLQTHSTNPLLDADTISRAIEIYFAAWPEHDSLFGVTRLQARLWSRDGQPLNHDPSELLRTQDLEPIYLENSCLYLFSREKMLESRIRIGDRPVLYEIGPEEALDIDDEAHFRLAETLLARARTG